MHESANGRAVRGQRRCRRPVQHAGRRVRRRVADDTFKVELSELAFLGLTLKPKLTAKVVVREDGSGCEVRVEDMN